MKRMSAKLLRAYEDDDWVQKLVPAEGGLVMDRWLRESLPKRMIFAFQYGDIIASQKSQRILDVGGGVSSLTPRLCQASTYSLVDILAHGGLDAIRGWEAEFGRKILIEGDWYKALDEVGNYDVIIANDLFPNVDQRLELFLERTLPLATEVRLSLTFHDTPRFYMCRRIDAEEFMCLLAWSGRQTATALERFAERIVSPDFSALEAGQESIYTNGRQIVLATLRGYRDG
jgi:hypothetical protein